MDDKDAAWLAQRVENVVHSVMSRGAGNPILTLSQIVALHVCSMDNNDSIVMRDIKALGDEVTRCAESMVKAAVKMALGQDTAEYQAMLRRSVRDGYTTDPFLNTAIDLARREGASAVAALLASRDNNATVQRNIRAALAGQDVTRWSAMLDIQCPYSTGG